MSQTILSWTPSQGYPTATHFTSINPTHVAALESLLSQAIADYAVSTSFWQRNWFLQIIRGAEASLTVISAQLVLATATDAQPQVTEALVEATYNLKDLADYQNVYGFNLNPGGNYFFTVLFVALFVSNLVMYIWSRYHWFNVAFILGFLVELIGFIARVLSVGDNRNDNYYLAQYVTLTIAPAFFMAGIYVLFGQMIVIHGRQYSKLKPMWYTYFFVTTDIISLIIQGTGGGIASGASNDNLSLDSGTWIMFGGVVFQVAAMTVFWYFWIDFLLRLFFHDARSFTLNGRTDTVKPSFLNFFLMLINTSYAQSYKRVVLEQYYNPQFLTIRARKLVPYFPLAMTLAVLAIYIRCAYRVAELKEGFDGYLAHHEVFLLALDATMIAIAGLILAVFHPYFTFGNNSTLKLKNIKKNHDESHASSGSTEKV